MPLGAEVVAGLALYQRADGRYELTQRIGGSPGYDLELLGEGGFTEVALSLARRFGDASFGLQLGLPFTGIDETINRRFDDAEFSDREETLETNLDDAVFVTAGGEATVGPVSLGAFFQLPSTGTVATRREAGGVVNESSFELGIPPAFGGGLAVQVVPGLQLAGEYRRQAWESAEIDGTDWRELPSDSRPRGYKDQDAWGVGIEWQPQDDDAPVNRSLIWRAGYGSEPWMVAGPSFGRVLDQTFSAGLGVPFREGNGRIDLALRYTRRRESNSDLRENVVGFVLGVAFARQPREF